MNILLILSHSIEEYDQLKLLASLGYDAWSLGGYIDPHSPHDPKRPAVPEATQHPELKAVVDSLGQRDNIAAAAEDIPAPILDWLGDDGAIIIHHYLDKRLVPQWKRLRDWKRGAPGRRIIFRSVGQSVEDTERFIAPMRAEGLERVCYSPKEVNIPRFSGMDALIRFYKDPAEYGPWIGDVPAVINITQHLYQRSLENDGTLKPTGKEWTNFAFWREATIGLPAIPSGPGSEALPDGTGTLPYEDMKRLLQRAQAYLYTGTQPASYTLGLIEAMMTGIPVVSIGPTWMQAFPYGPDLFEGHEIARYGGPTPVDAHDALYRLLKDPEHRAAESEWARARAVELFGRDKIAAEWKAYLG